MKNQKFNALFTYLNSNRSSTTSKNHVDIEKEMDSKSFSHVVYTDVKFLHH